MEIESVESLYRSLFPSKSLPAAGALATLLVITGALDIEDAANAVGVKPEDLVNEAVAWRLAADLNND
jgi:hypothetical protein